jgi:hypothetical protein
MFFILIYLWVKIWQFLQYTQKVFINIYIIFEIDINIKEDKSLIIN